MIDRLGGGEPDSEGAALAGGQGDGPAEEERAALVDALEAALGVGDGLDRVPRQAGGGIGTGLDTDALEVVAKASQPAEATSPATSCGVLGPVRGSPISSGSLW